MVKENIAGDQLETPPQKDAPEPVHRPPVSPVKEKNRQFKIDIFQDWCKTCGICVAFCSRGCLTLDEETALLRADSERCTGCGWCEIHCPDFAISVNGRKSETPEKDNENEALLETQVAKSA